MAMSHSSLPHHGSRSPLPSQATLPPDLSGLLEWVRLATLKSGALAHSVPTWQTP